MHQQPNESVADFAHRFTETQHELEKLLPKIHRAADADGNDEVELIYSFSIKLKKSISKDLMSRDFKFKSLEEIISAAQRYELHSDSLPGKDFEELPAWELTKHAKPEPVAVYSGPIQSRPSPSPSHFSQQQDFSHSNSSCNVPASGRPRPNQHHSSGSNFQNPSNSPTGIPSGNSGKSSSRPQGTSEICNMFNKFKRSTCELPNNKCFYHRLHKCQACHKWGCKSCNDRSTGQVDFTKSKAKPQDQAHVASTIAASSGQSASCENGPSFPQSDQASPSPDLTTILLSMHNFCSHCPFAWKSWKGLQFPPLWLPAPAAPNPGSAPGPDSLLQAPAYSYPAITAIPNHLLIPALDLANKHILWTPITSAGVSLPLPIDSCCSLSLVSKAHADVIALKHPHLTFTKLPSSLPVAVANLFIAQCYRSQAGSNNLGKWPSFHLFHAGRTRIGLANPVRPKSFEDNQGPHRPFQIESSFC